MTRPDVSVVIPMYQEVENAADTLTAVAEVLEREGWDFELVPVSDGSTDGTAGVLEHIAADDPRVSPVVYVHNRGRGYALRQGFALARGRYIVSLDADLSYTPDHAVRMVRVLLEDPEVDVVLASPYMPGGSVEGVPFVRLALSKTGNWVLRRSLAKPIYTSTGIVRAYRREALVPLDLSSDGKEIHLEILSQALDMGLKVVEMPATLRSRKRGTSKFRPRRTVASHLEFSLFERPAALFVATGLMLLLLGMVVGLYLLTVYVGGGLNPERPLMTVMVLLVLGGSFGLSFGVLATQMLSLRRSVTRLQRDIRVLGTQLERSSSDDE